MAEDKSSFVLYADQRSIIDMLPNDKAGELFKYIFAYVNDENPTTDDPLIKLAFEPIKLQLKRDLKKWDNIRKKRSEAGKKSAEIRQQQKLTSVEQNEQVLTSVDCVEQTSTNSTVNVNDNVNVNVNVNDNVINNTIPSIDEFVAYAVSLKPNVNTEQVKFKYNAWLVNNWKVNRKGKDVDIKNWKTTLSNTMQYFDEKPLNSNPFKITM